MREERVKRDISGLCRVGEKGMENQETMCDMSGNPFVGLFSDVNDALSFSLQATGQDSSPDSVAGHKSESQESPSGSEGNDKVASVEKFVKEVFGLTLKNAEETRKSVDLDLLQYTVFERLVMPDSESFEDKMWDCNVTQVQAIVYLYESYCRFLRCKKNVESEKVQRNIDDETVESIRKIILRNASTALQEPEIFEGQQIHRQFADLCMEDFTGSPELHLFAEGIVTEMSTAKNGEDSTCFKAFAPILDIVYEEVLKGDLRTFRRQWTSVLQLFASIDHLAKILIEHSTPKSTEGRAYGETLLGELLSLSCLPKTPDGTYDFFEKPLQETTLVEESSVWLTLDILCESLHKVFYSLLKTSKSSRHLTLEWLGNCLYANAGRGKLWNSNDIGFGAAAAALYVSDGFMLNLSNVLLRLCQPFCGKLDPSSVPRIDPTYYAAENNEQIHMKGMTSETCLIPTPEGETRPVAKSFSFITECFFMTHRTLDLGYRVVMEKFARTNHEVMRLQRTYASTKAAGANSEVLRMILQRMTEESKKYFSLRASLTAPGFLNILAKFHRTTAHWLVQVYLHDINEPDEEFGFAPSESRQVFPLPENVPSTLRCVPELIVENTLGFICFIHRFNLDLFEEQGPEFLNPILTELIVLMGSQKRLYNPHLRAHLAEGLESLLPPEDHIRPESSSTMGTYQREQLFVNHPHRQHIVVNLLRVFVSIEMTGQSVQFEQKFNYRRPMYDVMDYLWKISEHRKIFITLAKEAEANMEAVKPPLFLRFINLLMNDAVFLLDEALSNMAQLRQLINARDSGEWDKLPPQERSQQSNYLQHVGMLAKFDNILGRKTIQMLKMLTTEIKSIFCHPTMVDRIASMLNYLLLQLVGPNKKNLKVNDQKEYAFNPADLVLNICEIYINLSKNESFTLAVSQDGRSYRPELFKLADNVLVRIGGVGILNDLDQFARSVEEAAKQKKEEDEILVDAPEEFFDPIMSTLMTDPVILPSSRMSIDRQTIARHLLSDQTDPFNRSPLTMDMVKSNDELRERIQEWLSRKKQERSNK